MDKIYISFEAEPEIIADLVEFFNTGEIEHSDPVPVKSSADALDSPIGASELIAGLGLLTVAFSTLESALKVADKLLDILKKQKKGVVLKNPKTGQKLGKLDQNSTLNEVQKLIKK